MPRKKEKKAEGAPLWVMTYGDLMSLLLVFFIMLFAISEIVDPELYEAIVDQIREEFVGRSGGGRMPSEENPELSLLQVLEALRQQTAEQRRRSRADDPGMEGPEMEVTQVREGMQYIVGGRIEFEPGSADLTDKGRERLDQVAELIRGYNNIVDIRGHADVNERSSLRRHSDLSSLSYARARTAQAYLTERGIRSQRLRLVAVADNDPLARRVYEPQDLAPNRRVEVVVREALVEQFQQPQRRR